MLRVSTVHDHERMSTQDLLLSLEAAVERGETDFYIQASGQHDIGGPLWNREGKKLRFTVSNPGQRVGSMCLPDTEILVEGPAPADVGWLNAGGRIVVRGDAGDTAGHCAAAGRIYIGGRAGARSGSLMKHDPLYEPPELWVLKSVGSFSFEFMGGGRAVVCGCESRTLPSVLGERPCVGMVGGVVYFRGPLGSLPPDVRVRPLDEGDVVWLDAGLDDFLAAIDRPGLREELSVWKHWKKIEPLPFEEREHEEIPSLAQFRATEWVKDGIFSDVCPDDFAVNGLVARGDCRLRVPVWENARFAAPCEFHCPASIPSQRRFNLLREGKVEEACRLVLDYTPFPGSVCGGVCPNPCMEGCTRNELDSPVQIGKLGSCSADIRLESPVKRSGKHPGVIGGGVGGLTAAWQLARMGHEVTVYEADAHMGGKLEQVIPRERLNHDLLLKELKRIEEMGVHFVTNCPVDAKRFAELRKKHDALIVATGGHVPRIFPWPGHEKAVGGIDFLKAVNRGEKPRVPESVVVIGCGNAGMDAAAGAFAMGARQVTCIDVQRPAAFAHEIAHIESLGGRLVWPVPDQGDHGQRPDRPGRHADSRRDGHHRHRRIAGPLLSARRAEEVPRPAGARGRSERDGRRFRRGRRDQPRTAGPRHRHGPPSRPGRRRLAARREVRGRAQGASARAAAAYGLFCQISQPGTAPAPRGSRALRQLRHLPGLRNVPQVLPGKGH